MTIIFFKYLTLFFSIFLMICGILMFFKPKMAISIISKAGKTKLIHFGELLIRALIGLSFILSSPLSISPFIFKIFGYFLVVSAIIIMLVPRRFHQFFSNRSANFLKPVYLIILSPLPVIAGIYILNSYQFI